MYFAGFKTNLMKKAVIFFVFALLLLPGCTIQRSGEIPENTNANTKAEKAENANSGALRSGKPSDISKATSNERQPPPEQTSGKKQCLDADTGDKMLLESQTFPVNFAPFENSCFVTAHDPEFDNPPLGSEFSIYRNGEQIFVFPDQFNGVTVGCWVEAVSFEDLNDDNLTDVIVAGMCSAKSAPYSENMVYVNTGRSFTTNEQANYELTEFKKIKDISNFVKQNRDIFFR